MKKEILKFTFKTIKPTGRWKSFEHNINEIKIKGKVVGVIRDEKPYKIRLQVIKKDIMEDNNANCEWKWITLKKESESLQEAKDFLNKYVSEINNKYKIYLGEGDK